jgi:hypothetical protein
MSRARSLLVLVAVSFVLVAAACADSTGPQPHALTCDVNNPNVCR